MTRSLPRLAVFALLITLLATGNSFALHHRSTRNSNTDPNHKPRKPHRHIVWNPLLKGSHESMVAQNEEIDRLQLPRIENEEELEALEARRELVPLEDSHYLHVAPNLQPSRRYCKPWTRDFVEDLGKAYYEEFHQPIQINSAVRTAEQQHKLRRRNRNAAPEAGETASSHLAGLTVDIAKRGLTRKQHRWLSEYFLTMKNQGLIEGAEERRQACFHVMVAERYGPWRDEQLGIVRPPSVVTVAPAVSASAPLPSALSVAPATVIPTSSALPAPEPVVPLGPEE